MFDITMVGYGAIGHAVADALRGDGRMRVGQIVALESDVPEVRRELPDASVATCIEALPRRPRIVLECAGHRAVTEHVLPALRQGIDCIVCSIGALAEPGLPEAVEDAAGSSGARAQLLSGAVGGIDALASARIGGLADVTYTGCKPPRGWQDTPAEDALDLDHLAGPAVIFEGSARDAARLYPKNANVAATVSLAGVGFDRTRVRLIADPAVERNMHRVHARGAFGELEFSVANLALPANPKTSALVVYSAVRALRNRINPISI